MSIELDYMFISALLESKDFTFLLEKEFKDDYLIGAAKDLYRRIVEHKKEYRVLPTKGLIHEMYGLELPNSEGTLAHYYDQVIKRNLFDNIQNLMVQVSTDIKDDDPDKALGKMKEFCKNTYGLIGAKTILRPQISRELKKKYEEFVAGKRGIKTPWETLDLWTNGWYKGDVSFIVARSGIGKTWATMPIVNAAVKDGFRVLYISGEMMAEDVFFRQIAMELKLPYSDLRKGRLSPEKEKQMVDYIFNESDDNFAYLDVTSNRGKDRGITYDSIQFGIDKYSPNLVIADSCYRFKPSRNARDRNDSMAIIADDLKDLASINKIHILATTQMNRESIKTKKKDQPFGLEGIAMSDAIGWNATNVIGLFAPSSDEASGQKSRKMYVYPIKIREGEADKGKMILNWNFETMDFTEIKSVIDEDLYGRMGKSFAKGYPSIGDIRSEKDSSGRFGF